MVIGGMTIWTFIATDGTTEERGYVLSENDNIPISYYIQKIKQTFINKHPTVDINSINVNYLDNYKKGE